MFKDYLLEGQNENTAKALLKNAGKEDSYEPLLSITEPFKSTTQGKNNKHLPKLVNFYLEGIPPQTIQEYYYRFIKNDKINNKPIDKLEFKEFEQLVDSTATKVDIEDKQIDEKPIYEDDNVQIFLGNSKEKCIKYGQGRKYGFCISRLDNSNLYHGYRKDGATFYFIYFKNKESQNKAPENLIVIHAYPDNQYQINYSTPNRDDRITKDEILEQFPVLEPIFDKIIKYIPHSEKEERIYNIIQNTQSINDLKTLDDKLLFIEMGKEIENSDWKNIPENILQTILSKYVEVGNYDIPHEFETTYPKLWKRYIEKLKQRVNIKLSNEIINLSDDEKTIIQNTPDIVLPETINNISKDPHNAYKYASEVLKGQNVPQVIYNALSDEQKKQVKSIEKVEESIKNKLHSILNEELIIESSKPKNKKPKSKFGTYTKNGRTFFGWYPGTETGGQEFNSDNAPSEGTSDE